MGEILFMGPVGSGKTLLMRRLQTLSDEKRLTPFDPIPVTKPSKGMESTTFKFKGMSFIFKELAGASIQEWEQHSRSAKALVFVFDGGDLTKMATNIVWLNEVLTSHHCEQKSVLIVLAKCDIPDCVRFNVIDEIVGFDRVLNPMRISFLETSSVVGVGLSDILHWIADKMK